MNAKRIWIVLLVMAMLALVAMTASAQGGRGNGPGNGTGTGTQTQTNTQTQTETQTQTQTATQNAMPSGLGYGYQGGRNEDAGPRGNTYMNANMGSGLFLNLPPAAVDELPQDIVDLMMSGWLDEQHAYAVYSAVIEQFGPVRPFTNILRSEAQHIAAWEMLFERYDIAIPEVPEFDLPTYDTLADACTVAADAEVANFDLYDAMFAAFEPYPDLTYVAQVLRDASEFSHLPAFEMCAS
ncbi:MAG: hypothetical protein IPM16_00450 [Chloroflexi bacterium]|nr:hypothetical protein [Chloroflexota bacterium]